MTKKKPWLTLLKDYGTIIKTSDSSRRGEHGDSRDFGANPNACKEKYHVNIN